MTDESIAVAVMESTGENRPALVRLILAMYLGEHCKYCDRKFVALDDLKDAVFAGYHSRGRLACQDCWQANNPAQQDDR